MKNSICLIILSVLFLSFILPPKIQAQETNKHFNKYALEFQIGSNFSLNSFEGSVFSGKYNFDRDNSFRLGLSINVRNQNNSTTNHNLNYEVFTLSNGMKQNTYKISFEYLKNNYLYNDFNFYFGGGPVISYTTSSTNSRDDYGNTNDILQITRGYGIRFLTGIEWFFKDNMSLSGEYGLDYQYQALSSGANQNGNTNYTHGSSYIVAPVGVKLGLSIYF